MSEQAEQTAPQASAYDALPPKQRRFVDLYLLYLNATRAARETGYRHPNKQGPRLLVNVGVKAAIAEQMKAAAMSPEEVLFRLRLQATASAEDFIRFVRVQRQQQVWAPIAVAIEEKRLEIEVERETQARLGQDRDAKADGRLADLEAALVRLEVMQEKAPTRLVRIDGPVEEVVEEHFDLRRMQRAGRLGLIKSVKREKDGGVKVELYDARAALELIGRHLGLFGPKGTEDDPVISEVRVSIRAARREGAND